MSSVHKNCGQNSSSALAGRTPMHMSMSTLWLAQYCHCMPMRMGVPASALGSTIGHAHVHGRACLYTRQYNWTHPCTWACQTPQNMIICKTLSGKVMKMK